MNPEDRNYSGVMRIIGYDRISVSGRNKQVNINFAALESLDRGDQLYIHSVFLWNEFLKRKDSYDAPNSKEIAGWMREIISSRDHNDESFGFYSTYEPIELPDFKVTINPARKIIRLRYEVDVNGLLAPAKQNLREAGYEINEARIINRKLGEWNLSRIKD